MERNHKNRISLLSKKKKRGGGMGRGGRRKGKGITKYLLEENYQNKPNNVT